MTDVRVPTGDALREGTLARADDPTEVAEVIAFLFPDDSLFGESHVLSVNVNSD